jgi:hypothetical protein
MIVTRILAVVPQFLLILVCAIAALRAEAEVVYRFGTAGQEYGKAMTVDHANDIIVASLFQNTVDFDPGPGTVTLGAGQLGVKMAIAKYRTDGSLVWARSIAGIAPTAATTVVPHGVAVDAADSIYVIGYFGITDASGANAVPSTVDFDPGPGIASRTNSGERDPFVAKYDASGNLLWAKTIGNTSVAPTNTEERAWDLAVDGAGAVYFCGFLHGTYDFDLDHPGTRTYTSSGGGDAFLVKYDANGNYAWGYGFGGASDEDGLSVALDGAGHVLFQGHFSGTVDFDPGPANSSLTSAGATDLFVARYTTDGDFQQVIRIGATSPETSPPGTMRTDPSGNVYLTGRFRGTVDLDPDPAVTRNISNPGAGATDEILVVTYTGDLALRWGWNIPSDGGLDGGHRTAIDSRGNIYVTGWFSGTSDFSHGLGTGNLTSANAAIGGASDVFLAKYDANGDFLWVHGFGGVVADQTQMSIAAGMTVDHGDDVWITGQFYGQADFDPAPENEILLVTAGMNDTFLAKYDSGGNVWRDADGDGAPDGCCDCNSMDGGAFAVPAEVTEQLFGVDKETLSWESLAPAAGSATFYDVARGTLGEWPVGSGSPVCLDSGISATTLPDAQAPAPSSGWWYLVRGVNSCGEGSYGFASDGVERSTAACP